MGCSSSNDNKKPSEVDKRNKKLQHQNTKPHNQNQYGQGQGYHPQAAQANLNTFGSKNQVGFNNYQKDRKLSINTGVIPIQQA